MRGTGGTRNSRLPPFPTTGCPARTVATDATPDTGRRTPLKGAARKVRGASPVTRSGCGQTRAFPVRSSTDFRRRQRFRFRTRVRLLATRSAANRAQPRSCATSPKRKRAPAELSGECDRSRDDWRRTNGATSGRLGAAVGVRLHRSRRAGCPSAWKRGASRGFRAACPQAVRRSGWPELLGWTERVTRIDAGRVLVLLASRDSMTSR